MADWDRHHPLYELFDELVRRALDRELSAGSDDEIADYLTLLLLNFAHTDRVFAITDREGRRVRSVSEMLEEGDVLLNADSFEREREVHKHIGDFILFWMGVYPEFLKHLRAEFFPDRGCDYARQGSESYHVVSTFDHKPYDHEAPKFRRLSERFDAYAACLHTIRDVLPRPA